MSTLFRNVSNAVEFVLYIFKTGYLGLSLFHVETSGVVGVELGEFTTFGVTFGVVFVVVEGAVIGRDTVEVAHVFGFGALFVGEECFVHLLAMADTDNLDIFFLTSKEFGFKFRLPSSL